MDGSVKLRYDGGDVLDIALVGAIDFTNAQSVSDGIRAEIDRRRTTAVRVDLSDATFFDSSGIAVLVQARRLVTGLGRRFDLHGANAAVFEHLDLVGLVDLWQIPRPRPTHPTGRTD